MAGDEADDAAKIAILKDALYDKVRDHGSELRLFTQKDLMELGIIPAGNLLLLVRVVQALTDDKLFVGVNSGAGIAWRWRSREDAKKYTSLPNDETMMVYAVVDEAGADGIWNRTIKHKLNMHEAVVKNCIKYLETKGYIASMKNVEHPNKKMYIKANLRPSERATGGPWFTDGELDSVFIAELEDIVFEYIKTHSAYLGNQGPPRDAAGLRAPNKGIVKTEAEPSRGVKRPATEITNDDQAGPTKTHHADGTATSTSGAAGRPRGKVYLPMPAGYRHYPTVLDIAQMINDASFTNNTTLGPHEIQQLVDVLTYDGLIEPIKVNGRRGYRVTRPTKQDTVAFSERRKQREQDGGVLIDAPRMGVKPPTNGLTEAPCGKCPVFELCEEGGPVSPGNCVYFMQWLDIEDSVLARPNGAVTV
ncbi:RNA polymerase Rpc34 [Lasiosphaeria hispida]|uniref:RNA polymerase Rpc34 n=1 Tax=Lasiosphaeria hispida TaxID=260671 RepID=A0AAJ0HT95_9PEZI|nr:RNA polymerase Rpc34 [Lasiosphaeria hispida]